MAKFRKKPVVIEAFRWYTDEVPEWWRKLSEKFYINVGTGSVFIPTLEGTMECQKGDWIIKGIKGELYPCNADIFKQTYELAE